MNTCINLEESTLTTIFTVFLFALGASVMSCTDEGIGRTTITVVPNHTPQPDMVDVPEEQWATTEMLREMIAEQKAKEARELAEAEAKAAEDALKKEAEVTARLEAQQEAERVAAERMERRRAKVSLRDMRKLSDSEKAKTARGYRESIVGTRPLESFPNPRDVRSDPSDVRKGRDSVSMNGASGLNRPNPNQDAPRGTVKARAEKRVGGGHLFQPRSREPPLGKIMPPGRFFRARLLGNVNVTALNAPVFAEILHPDGEVIGIAVGTASLHRSLKNRALFSFDTIHLHDGQSVKGALQGFESDLSLGIIGFAERKTFGSIVNSIAETLLAALSLEVDTGSSDFGSVFKVQLADRLVQQAQNRVDEIDLTRQVTISRDAAFWVASTQEIRAEQSSPVNRELQSITQAAFHSTMESKDLGEDRKQELLTAYERLSKRLKDVR